MSRCVKIIGVSWLFVSAALLAESVPSRYAPDWAALKRLNAESIKRLTFQDEVLAMAYAEVFIANFERGDVPPEWLVVAKNDLLRRGNSAAPLLLDLFESHPLQQFRDELLKKIEDYPNINITPFLDAARSYWKKHKYDTPPRTCYAIAKILSRHGSEADKTILAEMRDHPSKEVGFVVAPDLERMTRRLDGTLKPDEWHGAPPVGYHWTKGTSEESKAAESKLAPSKEKAASLLPRLAAGMLIAAVLVMLWLLFKRKVR